MAIGAIVKWRKDMADAPQFSYIEKSVKKGSILLTVQSTGIVQPENKVEIKAPIAGRVEKVLVKEGMRVMKGQLLALMSSSERAALLDAASGKGKEELSNWEAMYRPTPILAPITGMIIQRNVESGQSMTTTDPILVMSDRLTVKAQVDETDIAKLKIKQKATMTLDAYPNQELKATIDQIAFDAKTINNVTTYIVDVLPESTPIYMRSGMTANVNFVIAGKNDILLIPNESIKLVEGKSYVLLPQKEGDKIPPIKEIKTGLSDGKNTEVMEGLALNDRVLIKEFKMQDKKKSNGSPFSPMGGKPHGK